MSLKRLTNQEKKKIVKIKCICCGKKFPSQHKFNRMCNECKRRDGPPLDRL